MSRTWSEIWFATPLSKLVWAGGVPSASKWSARILRMSFSSIKSFPSATSALICEEDFCPLRSFQTISHQFQKQYKVFVLCRFPVDSEKYASSNDKSYDWKDQCQIQCPLLEGQLVFMIPGHFCMASKILAKHTLCSFHLGQQSNSVLNNAIFIDYGQCPSQWNDS